MTDTAKITVHNGLKRAEGVRGADGSLVWIQPGHQRTLLFTEAGYKALRRIDGLRLSDTGQADPLDHDADGNKGGSVPVDEPDDVEASTVALMLETSAEDVAAFVDGDDRPSDAVLRAYIEAKTGKRAHPNAKTETLVEKVKEAAQAAA